MTEKKMPYRSLNKKIPPTKTYKILIVDDHPIVREGLRRRIEKQSNLKVACEAGSGPEAIGCLKKVSPDAGIIDISLRSGNGINLIKRLRAEGWKFPILVLSVHDDVTYLDRALAAGAQGYIVKQEAPQSIIEGLLQVLKGMIYICEGMANKYFYRLGRMKAPRGEVNPLSTLSDREIEILEAVGRGRTTRQIAEALFLSTSTVETYKSRIKAKLGLEHVSELTVFAANLLQRDPSL